MIIDYQSNKTFYFGDKQGIVVSTGTAEDAGSPEVTSRRLSRFFHHLFLIVFLSFSFLFSHGR
jgi:hypothetical protein